MHSLWLAPDPGHAPVRCIASYHTPIPYLSLLPLFLLTDSTRLSPHALTAQAIYRSFPFCCTNSFSFSRNTGSHWPVLIILCFPVQPIFSQLLPTWQMLLPCTVVQCMPSTMCPIRFQWLTPLSWTLSPTWRSKCTTLLVLSRHRMISEATSHPNCFLRWSILFINSQGDTAAMFSQTDK